MRSNTVADAEAVQDIADSGVADDGKPYRDTAPQFDWEYNKHLNKVRLYRTDAGGKMALGKFDVKMSGVKLGMCLGFNHVSAQQIKMLGAVGDNTTSTELSVHYRELPDSTTEYNDFVFSRTVGSPHAIYSVNCVNMYASDDVYVHLSNFPSNAFTTLAQASTTVMAVIPMYSGSGAESFHTPSNPTSTNIGSMIVSELDVKMTDAMGQQIDFNGVEHSFQLLFEFFEKGHTLQQTKRPELLHGEHPQRIREHPPPRCPTSRCTHRHGHSRKNPKAARTCLITCIFFCWLAYNNHFSLLHSLCQSSYPNCSTPVEARAWPSLLLVAPSRSFLRQEAPPTIPTTTI